MVLTELHHPLLARVFRALEAEDMGRGRSIPNEVCCLRDVLREILKYHTARPFFREALDEVPSLSLVILVLKGIFFNELHEVNLLYVGSLDEISADAGLAARLRSHEEHALRQDGSLCHRVHVVNASVGIDVMHLAELLVVVDDWQSLSEVGVDAPLDRYFVVVGAAAGLRSLHAALEHLVLWYVEEEDLVRFNHVLLEEVGLIEGAREAIDEVSTRLRRSGDEPIDEDLDSELKGNKLAFLLYLQDLLTELGAFLCLCSHEITG